LVTLGLLTLACCLILGSLWLFTTLGDATKTPKETDSGAQTDTPSPTSYLPSVDFQGVSFSYDPSLATGVTQEIVPAYTDPGAPPWELSPEFRLITFEDYYPTPNEHIYPQLSVYPVDEYTSVNAEAGKLISSLKDFIESKPTSLSYNQDIPFLPAWNSSQAIAAGVRYLDFKNGEGVRFLTQYCQDICPIQNSLFFYTFQGLTDDGRFVVSLRLPVSNPLLEGEETRLVDDAFISEYPSYIQDMQDELNDQPDPGFAPDLLLLDAIVLSLFVR